MPSAKVLEQKKQLVAELSERLKASLTGVLVSYKGINVEDDTKLRRELREAGVNYTVIKNKLLSRATEKIGLEELNSVLEGTTALATSDDDYVAAARILSNYAKKNKDFKIKSGYLDGEVIGLDKIDSLAKLPSREVLLANVLGAFQAPIASFARAVQAIVDKGGADTAADEVAEEAAPAEVAVEEAKSEPAIEETVKEAAPEAPAEEAAPVEEPAKEEAPAEETAEKAAPADAE